MKDCGCTDRSGTSACPCVVGGQGVTQRLTVAALLVACILPTVLLVGVCSYMQHELLLIDCELRQLIRNCRCSRPVAAVDRLSEAVTPDQVKCIHWYRPIRTPKVV